MTPAHHEELNNNGSDEMDVALMFAGPITATSFKLDAWSAPSCLPKNPLPMEQKQFANAERPTSWYHTSDDDDSQSCDWSVDSSEDDPIVEDANQKENISEEIRFDFRLSQSLSFSENDECPCRVRFCSSIRIRHYEKSDPEDMVHLYYSAHELQRMIDSHRAEEETVSN